MVTPSGVSLYSHKAEQSLISLIRGIEGVHNHFTTAFMGITKDAENPMATKLEAWKNPKTKMWQVDRITYVAMGQENDALIKKETIIRPGICFFDALHYCSSFEYTENAMGKQPIPINMEQPKNSVHWKLAAKEASQAVDADGIVQPCAYGRILVDGNFTKQEMIVAEKSAAPPSDEGQSNVSVRMADQVLSDILSREGPQPVSSDILTAAQDRLLEVKKYNGVINLGDQIIKNFDRVLGNEFTSNYNFRLIESDFFLNDSIAGACFSAGISPFIKYVRGAPEYFPERAIQKICSKFNDAASKLVSENDKKLCTEFSKSTLFAFYMARAKVLYTEEKFAKSGLRDIEAAGKVMGLSDIDLQRLKTEYIDNGMKNKTFESIPDRVWWRSEDGHGLHVHLKRRMLKIEAERVLE